MRQLIAYLICFVLTGMASAQNFTYLPPGNLKPNSGTGLVDYTVYSPGIRFPLETGHAYANSQVYGPGGQFGPGGGQCDKGNYAYPWQDNFCETRDKIAKYYSPICPNKYAHLGQDVRAATCEDNKNWVVAVEDGEIWEVGPFWVTLKTKDNVYYDYLHMSSVQVKGSNKVKRGGRLGKVSNAFGGGKTTFHLHFQIRKIHPFHKGHVIAVPPYLSLIRAYERMMGEKGTEVKNEAPQPPPPPKPVCETPMLHTPQSNATNVVATPSLGWHPAACGKEWADVYRVQIHTKPAYPPECDDLQTQNTCSKLIALNATTGNSETSVSLTANTLTYNTKYFWRVRAGHTSGGGSAWSSTWNFTTTHEPPVCGECQFSEGWRCLHRPDRTLCSLGMCMGGSCVEKPRCIPQPEICDNKDNDCNGNKDEGLMRACIGACGAGTETCVAGQWLNCSAKQANSCGSCSDSRKCTTACGTGTEQCSNGFWVNCTAPVCPQCVPVAEVCDNKDNDCDKDVDEGLSRQCMGACGMGTETCIAGQWKNCTAPELNSCNSCFSIKACQTLCGLGTETCLNGKWVNCTARLPSPETCNNIDDDCDGKADDGLVQACTNGCNNGTQTCIAGIWSACNAPACNQPLSAPTIIGPNEGAIQLPEGSNGDQILEWSAVPGAEQYEYIIRYATGDRSGQVIDSGKTQNRFRIFFFDPTGYYGLGIEWKVRAFKFDGTTGPWSEIKMHFFMHPVNLLIVCQEFNCPAPGTVYMIMGTVVHGYNGNPSRWIIEWISNQCLGGGSTTPIPWSHLWNYYRSTAKGGCF